VRKGGGGDGGLGGLGTGGGGGAGGGKTVVILRVDVKNLVEGIVVVVLLGIVAVETLYIEEGTVQ
jgi:hypothetical protein